MSFLGYYPKPAEPHCIKCGLGPVVWYRRLDSKNEYLLNIECVCGFKWTEPTLDSPAATVGNAMIEMAVDAFTDRPSFMGFPKIPRLRRLAYITEKIDGTNAHVHILDDGRVLAASKNRYITPAEDNHGFAKWVQQHTALLREVLGPGRHYGEWWGQGINRGYGLTEKRFSLFNVERWADIDVLTGEELHVVPTIAVVHEFDTGAVDAAIGRLKEIGSFAAPGFLRPEGVVVYHTAANAYFKQTIEGDEKPKGVAR